MCVPPIFQAPGLPAWLSNIDAKPRDFVHIIHIFQQESLESIAEVVEVLKAGWDVQKCGHFQQMTALGKGRLVQRLARQGPQEASPGAGACGSKEVIVNYVTRFIAM